MYQLLAQLLGLLAPHLLAQNALSEIVCVHVAQPLDLERRHASPIVFRRLGSRAAPAAVGVLERKITRIIAVVDLLLFACIPVLALLWSDIRAGAGAAGARLARVIRAGLEVLEQQLLVGHLLDLADAN